MWYQINLKNELNQYGVKHGSYHIIDTFFLCLWKLKLTST